MNSFIHSSEGIIAIIVIAIMLAYIMISLAISRKRDAIRQFSFFSVQIVIILLITFAFCVIFYIKEVYDRYITIPKSGLASVELSLVDMQANTLAISALVVTLAGIVLTILTIYKEKKAEINNNLVEESIIKLRNAEEAIKGLANIVSIQFVGEKHKECYYDAIQQFIEKSKNSVDGAFYTHFRVALISITSYMLSAQHNEINSVKEYDVIISAAEEIINNSDASNIDAQFAYLEALHALYQKIKYSIQKQPTSAEPDIKKALKYLKRVSGSIDDSFGHIANLYGLIYLWSGIAELRTQKDKDGINHLNHSLMYFEDALEKSPNKYEFYNHKAVALQQIYDVTGNSDTHEELINTYQKIYDLKPDYYKAHLNHAGMIIRDVRKELGLANLNTFPNYWEWIEQEHNNIDFERVLEQIKEAKEKLEKVQRLKPDFINGYYKMGEALTIEIVLIAKLKIPNLLFDRVKSAKDNFARARAISNDAIACMYCEYGLYRLIGEIQKASEVQREIATIQKK